MSTTTQQKTIPTTTTATERINSALDAWIAYIETSKQDEEYLCDVNNFIKEAVAMGLTRSMLQNWCKNEAKKTPNYKQDIIDFEKLALVKL